MTSSDASIDTLDLRVGGVDWLDFHGHTNSNIMNQTKGVPIYEIYQRKSTIFS